jgi:hypothetical protein
MPVEVCPAAGAVTEHTVREMPNHRNAFWGGWAWTNATHNANPDRIVGVRVELDNHRRIGNDGTDDRKKHKKLHRHLSQSIRICVPNLCIWAQSIFLFAKIGINTTKTATRIRLVLSVERNVGQRRIVPQPCARMEPANIPCLSHPFSESQSCVGPSPKSPFPQIARSPFSF